MTQDVSKLLQRAPGELVLLPEVGGEEAVGVNDGLEGSLKGVFEGLGRTGRLGVGILDTSKLEQTLNGGRGNKAGTTGSRDKLFKLDYCSHFQRGGCKPGKHTLTETDPHFPLCLTGRE